MGQRLADDVLAAAASQTVAIPAEATLSRVVADLAAELRLHVRRDQFGADLEEAFIPHPLGPVRVTLPGMGAKKRREDPRRDR